jgi:hypothetical protein
MCENEYNVSKTIYTSFWRYQIGDALVFFIRINVGKFRLPIFDNIYINKIFFTSTFNIFSVILNVIIE